MYRINPLPEMFIPVGLHEGLSCHKIILFNLFFCKNGTFSDFRQHKMFSVAVTKILFCFFTFKRGSSLKKSSPFHYSYSQKDKEKKATFMNSS